MIVTQRCGSAPRTAAAAASVLKTKRRKDSGLAYLIPVGVFFIVITLYPVVYAFYNSLFKWNWGTNREFVGLANYSVLFQDGAMWEAWGRTLFFAVTAVVFETAIGLVLAVFLNGLGRRSANLTRGVLMVPLMASGIVVASVWKIMLDPTFGVIPRTIGDILPTDAYLGDPKWAMVLIIAIDAWWQTAFAFIVLTAGLDSLPIEPFEAATVDGASAFQKFIYVTLPSLRPWILMVVGIRMVETLKVFDLIFGTTGGGPGRSTETIQVLTYLTGFKGMQMSDAMTMMMIALLLLGAVGIVISIIRRVVRHA